MILSLSTSSRIRLFWVTRWEERRPWNFAVRYPQLLSNLIVDMVPKAYPVHHDKILEGLKSIPLDQLNGRAEADTQLARFVPENDVRQFLLKNLARKVQVALSGELT